MKTKKVREPSSPKATREPSSPMKAMKAMKAMKVMKKEKVRRTRKERPAEVPQPGIRPGENRFPDAWGSIDRAPPSRTSGRRFSPVE